MNGTAMQSFSRLPIFLLAGGTEESRTEFVRCLLLTLTENSLTGFSIRQRDGFTPYSLSILASRYDLVIVDSATDSRQQTIVLTPYLHAEMGDSPWSIPWEGNWSGFIAALCEKLDGYSRCTPVWGCVLIGGRSSRMGRPKHLLKDGQGKTWLENTVATLRPFLDGIVVSGGGELPNAVASTLRIPDIPGVVGPLNGILAAGRWQPLVSWVLVACDMPNVSVEAVNWLLTGRRPGCWGRVPRFADSDRLEPLLAWYDFRAIHLFEEQLFSGNMRIGEVARDPRFAHPVIPQELCFAWENINTPEQLQDISR